MYVSPLDLDRYTSVCSSPLPSRFSLFHSEFRTSPHRLWDPARDDASTATHLACFSGAIGRHPLIHTEPFTRILITGRIILGVRAAPSYTGSAVLDRTPSQPKISRWVPIYPVPIPSIRTVRYSGQIRVYRSDTTENQLLLRASIFTYIITKSGQKPHTRPPYC